MSRASPTTCSTRSPYRRGGRRRVARAGQERLGGAAGCDGRPACAGRLETARPGRDRPVRLERSTRHYDGRLLSLEFLVHAWDYAAAVGREVNAPDSLSDYVLGLAQNIITPGGPQQAGFDDPIEVPADAGSLERLLAYTGRRSALAPARAKSRNASFSCGAATVTRTPSSP